MKYLNSGKARTAGLAFGILCLGIGSFCIGRHIKNVESQIAKKSPIAEGLVKQQKPSAARGRHEPTGKLTVPAHEPEITPLIQLRDTNDVVRLKDALDTEALSLKTPREQFVFWFAVMEHAAIYKSDECDVARSDRLWHSVFYTAESRLLKLIFLKEDGRLARYDFFGILNDEETRVAMQALNTARASSDPAYDVLLLYAFLLEDAAQGNKANGIHVNPEVPFMLGGGGSGVITYAEKAAISMAILPSSQADGRAFSMFRRFFRALLSHEQFCEMDVGYKKMIAGNLSASMERLIKKAEGFVFKGTDYGRAQAKRLLEQAVEIGATAELLIADEVRKENEERMRQWKSGLTV